jgi:hypothetical protein
MRAALPPVGDESAIGKDDVQERRLILLLPDGRESAARADRPQRTPAIRPNQVRTRRPLRRSHRPLRRASGDSC